MKVSSKESSPRIPTAVILRVSTDQQARRDRAGLDRQYEQYEESAKREGLEQICLKRIEGLPGTSMMESLEMQEVLDLVVDGKCKAIWISEESRLMRPDKFSDLSILETLKDYGVRLFLRDRTVDLSNPDDEFFTGINLLFAKRELSYIRDRMMSGKQTKRKRGDWVCGRQAAAYGFTTAKYNDRNWLVIDTDPENNIANVKRLFDLFLSGCTGFGELHRLTSIPYHTVKIALSNTIYTGYHIPRKVVHPNKQIRDVKWTFGKNKGKRRYQRRVMLPAEKCIPIKMLLGVKIVENGETRIKELDHPPISEEQFRMAQRLLKQKKEATWKRSSKTEDHFIYRNFLACTCDRPIRTLSYSSSKKKNGDKFRAEYYVCKGAQGVWDVATRAYSLPPATCKTRRMRREEVEPILDDYMERVFGRRDLLTEVIKESERAEREESTKEKIERLQAELAENDRCVERLDEMRMRGKMPLERFERNQEKLAIERRKAEKELAEVRPDFSTVDPKIWAPLAEQFIRWKTLEPRQKRMLLASVMPMFILSGEQGEGYHETRIVVHKCFVTLTGQQIELDDIKTLNGMGLNISQSTICINLNNFSVQQAHA